MRAFFVCFLLSLIFVTTPVLHAESSANERFSSEDVSDIVGDGFDFVSGASVAVLTIIRQLARTGISLANTSRRGLRNIIRNSSGALRKQAKRTLRRANTMKKNLVRQKKIFKRLSKRIIQIALAGGDVPKALANRASKSAEKIARSYIKLLGIQEEVAALEAQFNS